MLGAGGKERERFCHSCDKTLVSLVGAAINFLKNGTGSSRTPLDPSTMSKTAGAYKIRKIQASTAQEKKRQTHTDIL